MRHPQQTQIQSIPRSALNMASENIYIIKRTQTESKDVKDPRGDLGKINLFGTYTNIAAAKKAAANVLQEEGFDIEFFVQYDVNNGSTVWAHEDGVEVYAASSEGEVFTVEIETEPNALGLTGDGKSKVEKELYHVVQTTIFYNDDRSGSKRQSTIQGTYTSAEEARARALTTLVGEGVTKADFEEYDEFQGQEDWGFGEVVVIHAVGKFGENTLVSVIKN